MKKKLIIVVVIVLVVISVGGAVCSALFDGKRNTIEAKTVEVYKNSYGCDNTGLLLWVDESTVKAEYNTKNDTLKVYFRIDCFTHHDFVLDQTLVKPYAYGRDFDPLNCKLRQVYNYGKFNQRVSHSDKSFIVYNKEVTEDNFICLEVNLKDYIDTNKMLLIDDWGHYSDRFKYNEGPMMIALKMNIGLRTDFEGPVSYDSLNIAFFFEW